MDRASARAEPQASVSEAARRYEPRRFSPRGRNPAHVASCPGKYLPHYRKLGSRSHLKVRLSARRSAQGGRKAEGETGGGGGRRDGRGAGGETGGGAGGAKRGRAGRERKRAEACGTSGANEEGLQARNVTASSRALPKRKRMFHVKHSTAKHTRARRRITRHLAQSTGCVTQLRREPRARR